MVEIRADSDSPDSPDRLSTDKDVTILEVAKAAGVSATTVSRVFVHPNRVSSATRNKVQQIAQKLGYHSEPIRTYLDSSNPLHGLISLIVTDLENPVSSQIATSVHRECARYGFGVVVSDTEESSRAELAMIKRTLPVVDGIILGSSRVSEVSIRKPVVSVNRIVNGIPSVISADNIAIENAIKKLVEYGHKEIAYMPGPDNSWQNMVRASSVGEACKQLGVRHRQLPCAYPIGAASDSGFQAFLEHLSTAVITFNDAIALGLVQFLTEHGVKVPDDVSVIGIDDIPVSEIFMPSLSTVRVRRHDMGREAAVKLINKIRHKDDDNYAPISIPSIFIERSSIGSTNL